MSRPRKFPPTIYHHHSGHDRIRIDGKDIWLGLSGSQKAQAKYAEIVAKLAQGLPVSEVPTVVDHAGGQLLVGEISAKFLIEHVDRRYRRPDGSPTAEIEEFNQTMRPLVRLFGSKPANSLCLSDMEAVQAAMLSGSWLTPAECKRRHCGQLQVSRKTANKRMRRIIFMLRWAKRHRLLAVETYDACQDLEPIPEGTAGAKEYEEITPVPPAALEATLPWLNHVVGAMVRLQLLTAARPGEIVRMRPCDINQSGRFEIARGITIDTGGKVWSFEPKWSEGRTKTKKGRRIILFGPKAQEILAEFLQGREPTAYLFSPIEAMRRIRTAMRDARKSPVQPSQQTRGRGAKQRRAPGYHYGVGSYRVSIAKAIRRARKHGVQITPWHPHQLRHNAATHLVEQFGWDVAQTILGHRTLSTTRIYALDSWKKAAEAMRSAG